MAKQLQLRRGTTAQHSTFTGAVGEITVDTDKDVVVVHDGSTVGGKPMVGAVSSTDNAIVRFDGTSGQVQNSSVVIDDSGNVGIGTAPSAWDVNKKAIDLLGNGSAIVGGIASAGGDSNSTTVYNNAYYNAGWRYKYGTEFPATAYSVGGGEHYWLTAPLGTAGNPITWSTAMMLGNNGNLLVGTTTDNGVDKLQVNGSISSRAIPQHASGDLNNFKYITQTVGTYPSGYMSNIPIDDHGYLEIIVYAANVYVMQRFTTLGVLQTAGRVFVRCLNNGVWTAWVEK